MTAGAAVLTTIELERVLADADPAALLVPPRVLRRVIKKDAGLTGLGLQTPHHKSYVIGRHALLSVAGRADLGLPLGRELPSTVLLFPEPHPYRMRPLPAAPTLLKYWRLLFHARVHQAVAHSLPAGPAGEAVVRARVRRIGQTEADEIRAVLRQENYLLHSHNLRSVYEEFVAVFLELNCFAPHRLAPTFPAIGNLGAVFSVLDADVGAAGLFTATRLAGAPDPIQAAAGVEECEAAVSHPPPAARLGVTDHARLARAAVGAETRGNLVRAALLRERGAARTAADADLDRMTARLRAALAFSDDEAPVWRRVLGLLAARAASGFWTREARLLYDLQRLCIDQERDVYAVDLAEWLRSWGARPVVRPLPHQRPLSLVRRLRGAATRLASTRLTEADRKPLLDLLHAAVARHEGRLRERFRPLLLSALDDSGLRPRNYAEQVSRDKIIEELLDVVVDRGFLTMGDLRDALARNRLKLPDLSGPGEFVRGDPLLRANAALAVSLDGVYHRGEAYLRGLQSLSSLAFGTTLGRLLVLYLLLPLGGAFVILEGTQHVVHFVGSLAGRRHAVELVSVPSFAALALFLLAVLHVGWFRGRVVAAAGLLWRVVRGVFYDLPSGFLRLPPVRAVFQSRAYLLLYLLVLKPLIWAALVALVLGFLEVDWRAAVTGGVAVFLSAVLLLNSLIGLRVEEACGDAALRGWRLVSRDVVPGLFRLVLAFFRRALDDLERLLYTVDEALRFRGGDGRGALAAKAALGLVWFGVTYVVRFCVNLLVEPQVNPIKHFPVVTVSHKLVLAFFVQPMIAALSLTMDRALATSLAFGIGFCIPGVFGFLVWEFKENWRLYRANQPREMRPQAVGAHGETVARLLRPGFHSGTLPKLYARLRHAGGAGRGKPHEELHHVGEAVRRFVERNLLTLLAGSRAWGPGEPLRVGRIVLASNRIRIELVRGGQAVRIDLEEHAGRLVAGFAPGEGPASNGWLDHLPLEQVRAFTDALAGFYKAAGVDLVREQVGALVPEGAWVTFDDRGLVVEAAPTFDVGAVYDLNSIGPLPPRPLHPGGPPRFRTLSADKLIFARMPIRWDAWVEAWERDRAGKGHKPLLLRGAPMLPPGTARGRWAARRRV